MDTIKARGGKHLKQRIWRVRPSLLAVIPLTAFAMLFTVALLIAGMQEVQEAAQRGRQDGDGLQVVTWTPWNFAGLYGATSRPVAVADEQGPDPVAETAPVPWTDGDLKLLAQTVWAEARGVRTRKEQAAIVWCVLNRLDSGRYGDSIREVVTTPYQFAWAEDHPVEPDLVELAEDVLQRWNAEKAGEKDVGRVLPAEYLFFDGDELSIANHFRTTYEDTGTEWGWTLPDPYEEDR